ncbi:MAG: substrate-binding domain-containing protein [Spirochaeta sp.]|jgi:ribose transport system substrate-binding protein|nr:substrate-binding domain-containing protein [Spirochaeta sp.]
MRHSLRFLLILVVILFSLAMTQSIRTMVSLSQAVVDPGGTATTRDKHIAVFLPEQETLYFQQIHEGVASAAGRFDVAVSYHPIGADSQEFALAQYSGIDGAIIYPFLKNEEILQRLNELDQQRIPVALIEQDVVDDWPWTFVGTNNFEMGRRIGTQLAENPWDGRIVVVYSDKSPAVAAEKELIELGITTVMGDRLTAPIMRRQTGLNPLDAEALTYQLLRSDPPITSLVFTDTDDTLAALQVIIDLNLVGEVQVIGFGVTDAIMDHLERGVLDATVAVNPQRIGIEAVRVLSELMETGNAPGYVDTGVEVIRGNS